MTAGFGYSWSSVRKDLLAGATVAAISLPQAMAYALIAGVDPRFGLYSAIVVTAVASILGSSSHLINGPTNAISLVVFSALAFFGADARLDAFQAMFLLGIMIGVIQILLAVFRLAGLTRFISESVVLGFMAGAGLLIALGQVANFFGLHEQGSGHQYVIERFWLTITHGGTVNPHAFATGMATILLVILLRLLSRKYRLPQMEMLLALLVVTFTAAKLGWTVPHSGKALLSTVGAVPASLPKFHVPDIQFWWIREMSGSALAISFLGLLEALAIAKSIAATTRQRLDYNRQCMAEGVANLVGGFFQCLPGSGSLTRSAINFQSGAVTRMSGIFAACAVALVVLSVAPWTRFVPKAALAGLLLVTSARIVDWKRLGAAFRTSRHDAGLALITAFSAIFISVEFSILIGVALSVLLFVPRAARLKSSELVVTPEGLVRERKPFDPIDPDVIVYELEGELFFGAAPDVERAFDRLLELAGSRNVRFVILRLRRACNPDMVFFERLGHFLEAMRQPGVTVLMAGIHTGFTRGLRSLCAQGLMLEGDIFPERKKEYSSVRKAHRHACERLGRSPEDAGEAVPGFMI